MTNLNLSDRELLALIEANSELLRQIARDKFPTREEMLPLAQRLVELVKSSPTGLMVSEAGIGGIVWQS